MQADSFKPVGQQLSVRGGNGPLMPQQGAFAAVPVDARPNQSIRDITGRGGTMRGNNKSAPPQGAREVPMASAHQVQQQMLGAVAPQQITRPTGPAATPQESGGVPIPRRPAEEQPVQQRAVMGQPRPFLQRAALRSVDTYTVTLVGVAPDGQTYEVPIPFRAEFPVGTRLGNPEVQMVDGA